jgi:Mrp family chromosome partitioning ATPase
VLIAMVFFGAVASLGVLRTYPTYRSSGSVALPAALSVDAATQATRIGDEVALANSSLVRGPVLDRAGSGVKITAGAGSQNGVLTLTAEAPTAKRAAVVAAAYTSAYVDFKTQSSRRQFDVTVTSLRKALAAMDAQQSVAPAQADARTAQRRAYDAALQDVLVRRELASSSEPEIVAAPMIPLRPLSPPILPAAVIGLLAGLVVGLTVAAARDARDDSVRDEDELTVIATDVATALGTAKPAVIAIAGERNRPGGSTRAHNRRGNQQTAMPSPDWYTVVRAAVDARAAERANMIVQVTSTNERDSCVPVALNLAASFARNGRKTLLLAPDPLDGPGLLRLLPGGEGLRSLTDLHHGRAGELADIIEPVDGRPGLSVLLPGPCPGILDTLTDAQVQALFRDLRRAAEVVVVVTPSLLSRPGTRLVLPLTDEVVLVAGVGTSSLTGVRKALELAVACAENVNTLLAVGAHDSDRRARVRSGADTVLARRPARQATRRAEAGGAVVGRLPGRKAKVVAR